MNRHSRKNGGQKTGQHVPENCFMGKPPFGRRPHGGNVVFGKLEGLPCPSAFPLAASIFVEEGIDPSSQLRV